MLRLDHPQSVTIVLHDIADSGVLPVQLHGLKQIQPVSFWKASELFVSCVGIETLPTPSHLCSVRYFVRQAGQDASEVFENSFKMGKDT